MAWTDHKRSLGQVAFALCAFSLASTAAAQSPNTGSQAPATTAPPPVAIAPAPTGPTAAAPAPATPAAPTPVRDQKALDLLKAMSDKLAAAKTLRVDARGMREVLSTQNNMLIFFSTVHVDLKRPDKLNAVVNADGQKMRFVYDGKSLTIADTGADLFTRLDAPGTIDQALEAAAKKGTILALADFLYSDPYAVMTKGLTTAYEVKDTRMHASPTKHLAFAAPGIEWQIWIDRETKLPHLLTVSYTDTERHPRFMVELRNWAIDADIAANRFEFQPGANAAQIEFLPVK